MEKLKVLPYLTDVSTVDIHFGPCPITSHQEYPGAVIISLRYIQTMDGKTIHREQRNELEEMYRNQKEKFYEQIRIIDKNADEEIAALEREKQDINNLAKDLQEKVQTSLSKVDTVIR